MKEAGRTRLTSRGILQGACLVLGQKYWCVFMSELTSG